MTWYGFALLPWGLQIQDFLNLFLRENVMASPDSLIKAQPSQKLAQAGEGDVCVGGSAQNLLEDLIGAGACHLRSERKMSCDTPAHALQP